MVLRIDGNQIGVQIDNDDFEHFTTQESLHSMSCNPFDFNAPPDQLQGTELSLCKMAVGIMPEGAPGDNKDKWVYVVAVCEKHPRQDVHFVVTQECFGAEEDENESSNLPRVVTFTEFQQHGELLGRFESCTQSDILWYTDYMQDNYGNLPDTGVSFPSAEAHGPHGEKGGYDDKGKAIKIIEVV